MKNHHFPFIKYTWLWFLISIIMLVAGVGAMIYNKASAGHYFDMGIDFTGGTLMELKLEKSSQDASDQLKTAIDGVVPGTVSQITVTEQGNYIIQGKSLSSEQYDSIHKAISQKFGKFEEIQYTTIGPKIGSTLKQKAILALTVASFAIIAYIAFAFRKVPKRVSPWRFGICAVVALLHDVIVTLGVFALLGYEVDSLFITALLTIMGFSVHDTIVVFDRIRENLKNQGRDETFAQVADVSLNQTLSRSINTSLSTLFTLIALYIFGAPSIRIFTFALIFGITVGTYSSIFVATPMLVMWQKKSRVR